METKIYKAKHKENGQLFLVEALTLAGARSVVAEHVFDVSQASAKEVLAAAGTQVLKQSQAENVANAA